MHRTKLSQSTWQHSANWQNGRSLNKMLCDWLVCGIANPTIQKCLFTETDLTLDRAVSMAQAAELADKGAKELQAGIDKSVKDVLKVSSGR